MKSIFAITVLLFSLANSSYCEELKDIKNKELAFAIGASSVLFANNNNPFHIRVVTIPTEINECWGTIKSCPDYKLFITVATGDLYDEPLLYQLPAAKGWGAVEPLGARNERSEIGLKIQTMLPTANINSEERQQWKPVIYHVWLSENSATIEMD